MTAVDEGLVSDRLSVCDVGNSVSRTTVCQLDRGFEPGLSMGAPVFRY